MKKSILYPKEWLAIHPYTAVRPSDAYYVTLANELLAACTLTELPEPFRRKLCLYVAAMWKMSFPDSDCGDVSRRNILRFTGSRFRSGRCRPTGSPMR